MQSAFLPGGTVSATAETAVKVSEDRQDRTIEDRSEFSKLGRGETNQNHPDLKDLIQMKQQYCSEAECNRTENSINRLKKILNP